MLFWRLLPTSHRILLLLAIVYATNTLVLRGALTSFMELTPSEMLQRSEYWRMFTYPFAITGFWSIISASMILYFFAPEVEHILSARRFVIALSLFVVVHGMIYTPLMMASNLPLTGPEAAALFILTLYTFLYPSGEISLFGLFSVRATTMLAFIICASLLAPLLSPPLHPVAFIHVFADELFGVFTGFIFAYLYFGRGAERDFYPIFSSQQQKQAAPRRTSPSTASVGYPTMHSQSADDQPVAITLPEPSDDTELDEDHLNAILDKISEKGQASLTASERKFLQDYASKL